MLWYGINEDKHELHKMITDIIETLKPWLNAELWYSLKKDTEDVRENVNWNRQLDEITILE